MNLPDELNPQQVSPKTWETTRLLEALCVAILLALLAWFIISYRSTVIAPEDNLSKEGATITLPTKEEMIAQMSARAPSSTTVTVSPVERQKMIDAMQQKVSPAQGTTGMGQPTAPLPTISPAERQKMIDAMQQKTP